MFTFLLVVHTLIAAALVAVILMQRSEGGGLGMGGSPTGLMSARGAADFLTRATTVLAALFVAMSIGLAVLASVQRTPRVIDTSLARPGAVQGLAPAAPTPPSVPANAGGVPLAGDPLAGLAAATPGSASAPGTTVTNAATSAASATRPKPRAAHAGSGGEASSPSPASSAPAAASVTTPAPVPTVTPAPAPAGNSSPGTTNANSSGSSSQQ